tara:strand:+ start:964 stop:1332 length:369 start_codon:yes stop_codon:yes gene_type:complete
MNLRELKNIIKQEINKANSLSENKDCGCSKKKKIIENTLLTEGKKTCCHDDNYNEECCDKLWDLCCEPPKWEQPCCNDMPGYMRGPRKDMMDKGFSTQGGTVKKPPYGGGTGPTSGEMPRMG